MPATIIKKTSAKLTLGLGCTSSAYCVYTALHHVAWSVIEICKPVAMRTIFQIAHKVAATFGMPTSAWCACESRVCLHKRVSIGRRSTAKAHGMNCSCIVPIRTPVFCILLLCGEKRLCGSSNRRWFGLFYFLAFLAIHFHGDGGVFCQQLQPTALVKALSCFTQRASETKHTLRLLISAMLGIADTVRKFAMRQNHRHKARHMRMHTAVSLPFVEVYLLLICHLLAGMKLGLVY